MAGQQNDAVDVVVAVENWFLFRKFLHILHFTVQFMSQMSSESSMSSVSEPLSVVSQQFTAQYKGKVGSNFGNGKGRFCANIANQF